jgi:hypothetical protein
MGAGIPGTGMATLFYLVSALLMPLCELVRTVQGRSSWARWRLVCRHLAFALAMAGAAVATFLYLPRAVLPPDVTIGGVSSLLVTIVLFVTYLVAANVVALLVPRTVQLPEPKLVGLHEPRPVAAIDAELAELDLSQIDLTQTDPAEIDLPEVERTAVDLTVVELTDVEPAA